MQTINRQGTFVKWFLMDIIWCESQLKLPLVFSKFIFCPHSVMSKGFTLSKCPFLLSNVSWNSGPSPPDQSSSLVKLYFQIIWWILIKITLLWGFEVHCFSSRFIEVWLTHKNCIYLKCTMWSFDKHIHCKILNTCLSLNFKSPLPLTF